MNSELNTLYCSDAQANFLGVFDMSIGPDLLFYAYLPTIIILLLLGSVLIIREKFSFKSVALFSVGSLFSLWMINEIVHWTVIYHSVIATSWKYTLTLVSLIFTTLSWSIYSFFKESKSIRNLAYIQLVIPIITFFLASTDLVMPRYDYESCVGENGILWFIIYFFQIIYFITIYWFGKRVTYCQNNTQEFFVKKITLSILTFVALVFATTLLISDLTEIYSINLLIPTALILLVETIGFYSIRYQFFSFKIHQSELLTYTVIALVGSLFFVPKSSSHFIILGFTLLVLFILGKVVMKLNKQEQQQEEKLEKTNLKLMQLDASKNEFLSFATHQLRSPLTSFKWGLDIINDNAKKCNDSETVSIVAKLRMVADDMISTVNDLLDISKIEQGGFQIVTEDLDLIPLLDRISEEYRINAENKGLRLIFEPQIPTAVISGDSTKLRQVVGNLIDNAIKYTPSGSVTIRVQELENSYSIAITDTGLGISPEDLQKLFGKFKRGSAGKSSTSGSGLGLYLSKKIVELHHGDITASSEGQGRGSTFLITLPKK